MPNKPDKVTQQFVREGNFVVMPLCFPGVSTPVAPEDSCVTALTVTQHSAPASGVASRRDPLSTVYGGLSGRQARLFTAVPKAPGGYAIDMGPVEGMAHTVFVSVIGDSVLGCFNGPSGARIARTLQFTITDGVQEWAFYRKPYVTVAEFPGERILDAVLAPNALDLTCLTDRRIVRVVLEIVEEPGIHPKYPYRVPAAREVESIGNGDVRAPAIASLAVTPDGCVYAAHQGREIMRLSPGADGFVPTGVSLPFERQGWGWISTPDGRLVCADAEGTLRLFQPVDGSFRSIGQVIAPPVKALACVTAQRAYAFYGDGIGRFGRVDLRTGEVADLGAVLSVLGMKRYANTLCCACVGPDGEIYFGEDDRGGCLWIYFPPVA